MEHVSILIQSKLISKVETDFMDLVNFKTICGDMMPLALTQEIVVVTKYWANMYNENPLQF